MTLTIGFQFVSGRYHATPFGHHVNEGLIEWPPSPWRLLRSLISVGYTTCFWNDERPPISASSLIESLAGELPNYHLPQALGTHSRHYMPKGILNKGIEKTTLVFDTWARIGNEELLANWPSVNLSAEERSVLAEVLGNMNYLGRSESWVEARIISEEEERPTFNCVPETRAIPSETEREQIMLMAPQSASDYLIWKERELDQIYSSPELQLPQDRRPTKQLERKRQRASDPYPSSLIECLQKDTNWLRRHGWSQPPGSQRIMYLRPEKALSVGTLVSRQRSKRSRVSAILLSVTNASRNDHALPNVTRTLPQGDLLHRALVGIATKRSNREEPPTELIGKDERGLPLKGSHEHAHVQPLDLDNDGHLDHILIWAAMGLSGNAQSVIRAARKTYTKGGLEPLRLAISAIGEFSDLKGLSGGCGARLARLVGEATRWRSLTPFVAGRFIKRTGKNTLEAQIDSELESRLLPKPRKISILPTNGTHEFQRFRHYALSRRKGREPPMPVGHAVELEFDEPVTGPIALGYASHFGLGVFIADSK